MNGRKLQDRLYSGMGLAARHTGKLADAFRPNGPNDPLDKTNRFLRLPASFLSAGGGSSRTNRYGDPLWHGIFDASYTRPGDYLVMDFSSFFVASQEHLLPVLCVRTNRTISIAQPNMQTRVAANSYGGYIRTNAVMLIDRWPASILEGNKTSRAGAGLPTDQATPSWTVLLPRHADLVLSPGDIITDDLGRTAVIAGSELTNLGWRIHAKAAMT